MLKYMKQTLTELKAGIDGSTNNSRDLITPFSIRDRTSRQIINMETQALNEVLGQMDLIDIYTTFHPKAAEHTFSSRAHGTSTRLDPMLRKKSSFRNVPNIDRPTQSHRR